MHITKIKIKQDRVFVEYDKVVVVADKELLNKYSIDSPEHPVGAFKEAFQKMDFFLIELCELGDKPDDVVIMCEDVNITGLSFKYTDSELSSAIITGTKQLAYSNSPLVLNTPNKSINVGDGEFNKMVHLTDPCIAALKSVIEHAKNYVEGERLQVEIELPQTDDQEDEKVQAEVDADGNPVTFETLKENDQSGPIGDGINTTEDVRDEEEVQEPPV